MSHPLGAGFSLTVGVISLGLTVLAYLACRRTQDRRMLFLAGAFALFAIKGILTFIVYQTDIIAHNPMEIVSSSLDLGVVILLVAPFLLKNR